MIEVDQIKIILKNGNSFAEWQTRVNMTAIELRATRIEYIPPSLFHGSRAVIHYVQLIGTDKDKK